MSGGTFDYLQYRLTDIADDIQKAIDNNGQKPNDEYDYCPDFSQETLEEFRKGIELIRKAQVYMHRIDYLMAGDDGEDNFHSRLKEDLSKL